MMHLVITEAEANTHAEAIMAMVRAGQKVKLSYKQDTGKDLSLKQQGALFGVAYPVLMEHFGLYGEHEKLELHRAICGAVFGWRESGPFGGQSRRPRRTTTTNEDGERDPLSADAMGKFYQFVQREAMDKFGVWVPDPDPYYQIRGLYQSQGRKGWQ